jgi:hypothetical protein
MSLNTAGNMPGEVAVEWEFIRSAVEELHSFWNFHCDLVGNSSHVELMMNILQGPFKLIERAMKVSIVLGIGRLLDGNRNTLSLPRFQRTLGNHCPTEVVKSFENGRKVIDSVAEPIVDWRHNRYGHANKAAVLGIDTKLLPVVEDTVFVDVLAKFRGLLETIYKHFNGNEVPMHFRPRTGDANLLMTFIRLGFEAEQKELAEYGFPD